MLSGSQEKISTTKWKSMEEDSFHMTGNKSLASHLQNLDRITVFTDVNNIDSIDEESQNLHSEDHLYGVV